MSVCTFRDGTKVGDFLTPYIVAEVNTSHNGNMETAKQMIDAAVKAGCDCVKFQSFSAVSLCSKDYYRDNPMAKRFFTKFSFSENELLEAVSYSKKQGISFASTPYSVAEVDFLLEKCNVPYIKVASMDINNYPFLDYIARTGAPIVLATGMGDAGEIAKAVKTIQEAGGCNLCLLHCVSIYPVEVSCINLNNITGLRQMSGEKYPIGFSDHTLGIEIAPAAIALGAAMIEKHLTLDKSKIGMDNNMAIEPDEMARMVNYCHNVYASLGADERIITDAELAQRAKMRRSIVAAKDLQKGTILTIHDLDVKRPGTGLAPEMIYSLIGKTLARDVEADMLIKNSDVLL